MALKELRAASKSWVASIFVGLLVISFAIWGVNDVFSRRAGRGVAKVGDEWISAANYQRRYRSVLDQYESQSNRPLTSEEIEALGLKDAVLDQLIDQTALGIMARRLGLAVHDDSLKSAIQAIEAFRGVDGRFDPLTYQSRLGQAGFTPASFESEMRRQIAQVQLQDAVMDGSYMPRGLIEDLIVYRGEMRQVSYILLDPSLAGDIPPPDDAALKAYIESHAEKFSQPELRSFTAVLFRPKDFASKVEVSEEDIKASYDFDIDRYKVPEKRALRTIAFPDESAARAAYETVTSGKKTLEEIGKERGYTDADLAFVEQAKSEANDPEVANAAFAAPEPRLLEPVNGALAWTLVEIRSITPGFTKTIEDAHDEIKARLALDHAEDEIEAIVNQFIDGRAGGESMEELTKRLGLALLRFNAVDSKGQNVDGEPASLEPEAPELVAAAFATQEGTENDPDFLKGGGEYVVSIEEVQPPSLKPFEKIAAEARADYLNDERKKRLQDKAADLVDKYKTAGLGAAASAIGKAPVALPSPLRRDDESEILSSQLIEAVFTANAGELVAGPAAKSEGYILASPLAVAAPSPQDRVAGIETLAERLDEALDGDFLTQYIAAARQNLGVKVDRQVLDTAASNVR